MRLHKERSDCLYGVTETSMMSKLRFGRTFSISPTAAHSNGTEHFATSSIRNSPHHTGSRKLLFRRRRGRLRSCTRDTEGAIRQSAIAVLAEIGDAHDIPH